MLDFNCATYCGIWLGSTNQFRSGLISDLTCAILKKKLKVNQVKFTEFDKLIQARFNNFANKFRYDRGYNGYFGKLM